MTNLIFLVTNYHDSFQTAFTQSKSTCHKNCFFRHRFSLYLLTFSLKFYIKLLITHFFAKNLLTDYFCLFFTYYQKFSNQKLPFLNCLTVSLISYFRSCSTIVEHLVLRLFLSIFFSSKLYFHFKCRNYI